jgi:predicted RNase H-like nuclease (RuvC/YqgF family)
MTSTHDKIQSIVQTYLHAAPKPVGDLAVLIADTAKLIRFLLAEALGTAPVEAISTTDVEVRQLTEAIADNQKRFDTLRRESIADRTEFRTQAESDRAEFRRQIEEERRRSDLRFEAMQENIQRLFLEMTRTNHRVDNLEQAS